MTTIAYRAGVLAADTQATEDGLVTRCGKLRVVKDAIIGFAGGPYDFTAFCEWYGDRRKKLEIDDDDFAALVVTRDEVLYYDNKGRGLPISEDYAALGSGASVALTAMDYGASAIEAVEAACRRDAYTSAPVESLTL